jgi:hypothetical protein
LLSSHILREHPLLQPVAIAAMKLKFSNQAAVAAIDHLLANYKGTEKLSVSNLPSLVPQRFKHQQHFPPSFTA